jgi:acetylornithine deacetylase/succinyl-diaminopimelate desuccinylase-like protein
MEQVVQKVLERIESEAEELAELVLTLANTYGPVGQEAATARVVHDWYGRHGIESELLPLVGERANVVGRVRGSGGGRSLLFNAHLDTEASGHDYDTLMQVPDPNRVGAWREGDRIFGHTALNDRHAHALFMIAARALRDAGVDLAGDLVLTSVCGETGQAPVDEYRGLEYEGKGFGSSYLVEHGYRADYALVSETTDFASCWHHCGASYFKVTLRGRNMYTPRLKREGGLEDHPNAIVKAAAAVDAIEHWAIRYTEARTKSTPCGTVRPNAQVGAIRGGIPWRPNRSSTYCALYVDVRLLPDEDPADVEAEFRAMIDELGVGAEVDVIMTKRGALGTGIEPLHEAITSAHERVRGTEPPAEAEPAVVSMWRDTNVFNKAGIPSINFGPSRGVADVQGRGYLEVDGLVDAAKMYALIAMQISGSSELAAAAAATDRATRS